MVKFYSSGDECEYTGITEEAHGAVWFEFTFLEGHRAGQKGVTQRRPDEPKPAPCECCAWVADVVEKGARNG